MEQKWKKKENRDKTESSTVVQRSQRYITRRKRAGGRSEKGRGITGEEKFSEPCSEEDFVQNGEACLIYYQTIGHGRALVSVATHPPVKEPRASGESRRAGENKKESRARGR